MSNGFTYFQAFTVHIGRQLLLVPDSQLTVRVDLLEKTKDRDRELKSVFSVKHEVVSQNKATKTANANHKKQNDKRADDHVMYTFGGSPVRFGVDLVVCAFCKAM
jgi:hypothetical protein